ncbi:hypothetical protein ACLSU7_10150 [Bdellovibrio sp. HCB185ZH]|uniref:hypothetical protein n=1 Tax=Bdellovibrio sp. HCB185ZH TaxID=3394235 RepID=UPI0039A58EC6
MRLRSSFLAKITFAAITSSLLSQAVFAQHHAAPDSNLHHAYMDYSSAYYQKMAAIQAKQMMDMNNKVYAEYKKIESKILANPQTSLDALIHLGNNNPLMAMHQNQSHQQYPSMPSEEVMKPKYNLDVKYSKNLPAGEVAFISMSDNSKDKATVVVTVHEAARTNPFVLLEAFVNLGLVFDFGSIQGNKTTVAHGQNIHHHNYSALHVTFESLGKSLGLSMETGGNSSYGVSSTMELLELKANADAGSLTSQRALTQRNLELTQTIRMNTASFVPLKMLGDDKKMSALIEYARLKNVAVDSRLPYATALTNVQDQIDLRNKRQMDTLNADSKIQIRKQNAALEAGAAEREQIVKNESLSDMVKANDRAGVANAMDKMLPWAIMEPTEKTFWRDYVDAIRNPNYEGADILFRGMDTDEKLQEVRDSKGKLISGGLFSKRLTAGSGSHFYKLKGLPKTFETFGTRGVNEGKQISPLVQPHTLSRMMSNHAGNPAGSPFISLTYDLQVAHQFSSGKVVMNTDKMPTADSKEVLAALDKNASGGIVTLRIDKRRTLVNTISGFNGELEVLASMLIFPDEVLYMEKGVQLMVTKGTDNYLGQIDRLTKDEYYKNARSIVYQKTGINLPETYQEYAKQGEKKFQTGLTEMQDLFSRTNPNKPMSCSKVFN